MYQRAFTKNILFSGDNLDILRQYVAAESIDLIYLDPPFNSNRNYNVLYKEESGMWQSSASSDPATSQIKAFEDTWHWNRETEEQYRALVARGAKLGTLLKALVSVNGRNQMTAYLVMMAIRLVELHRVLKPTGSLYLHCDPTASHYLKLLLDCLFGAENFQNEIIWHYRRWTGNANSFLKMHDVLLFYTKQPKGYTYNISYTQYSGESFFRKQNFHTRVKDGAPYVTSIDEKGVKENDFWEENDLQDLNRILEYVENEEILNSLLLKYLQFLKKEFQSYAIDARDFKILERSIRKLQLRFGDIFPISILNSQAAERLGYPTQKPLALLERLIQASSNPGDVILDPFCGCGTTIHAAQKLGRAWLGIEKLPLALELIKKRLSVTFRLEAQKDYALHEVEENRQAASSPGYG